MALWGNDDNLVSSGTVSLNYSNKTVTGAGTTFGSVGFGVTGNVIRFGSRPGAFFGEAVIVSIAGTQSCTIGSTEGLSGGAISGAQYFLSELPKSSTQDQTFVGRQDASFNTIGQAIDVDAASAVGADALSAEIFTFPQGGFAISAGDRYLDSPNKLDGTPIEVIGVGTANATVTSLSPVGFSTIFVVVPPGVVVGDTINATIGGVAGQTIASIAATSVTLASNGGISTISVAVAKDSRIQFSNDNLVSLASTISNAVSITDKLYFQRKSGGYDRIVFGVSDGTSALFDGSSGKYRTSGSGWVGVQTYIDMHGNLRVKSETLVAMSGIQTGIHGLGYPTSENGGLIQP
tara:strand:+ start:158 stop:1201 length:1044 start_codon:yes stop_codon:yes gene_type:complete